MLASRNVIVQLGPGAAVALQQVAAKDGVNANEYLRKLLEGDPAFAAAMRELDARGLCVCEESKSRVENSAGQWVCALCESPWPEIERDAQDLPAAVI